MEGTHLESPSNLSWIINKILEEKSDYISIICAENKVFKCSGNLRNLKGEGEGVFFQRSRKSMIKADFKTLREIYANNFWREERDVYLFPVL